MSLIDINPRTILIRSTNWIGDAIMTTPAVRTIRENFPSAHISILSHPWVADVFAASPHVDEIILYRKKDRHRGVSGIWRLGRTLADRHFDLAIYLQNAFEAALIGKLAAIPNRAGYTTDGRSLLLTHRAKIRREIKKVHQVHYYQDMLKQLGLTPGSDELFLQLPPETIRWAHEFTTSHKSGPTIGLNPGAAYGPAKCWPAERYGMLAARLAKEHNATLLVFGTSADNTVAEAIKAQSPDRIVNLAGKTNLSEAMALIGACDAFVTNDSGLMHVGAALKTPLVAIFGSTDSVATGPYADNAVVIQKDLPCRPCLKTHCKSDFRCMTDISVDEIAATVAQILQTKSQG
ncbi:MAG: lipopolysaccharide heptosyltransferase II [Desulfobulbaceae bacterium]|nr:lipopolysaccharide heptosyltransferase II [Desulfobulbaceae bacterium]